MGALGRVLEGCGTSRWAPSTISRSSVSAFPFPFSSARSRDQQTADGTDKPAVIVIRPPRYRGVISRVGMHFQDAIAVASSKRNERRKEKWRATPTERRAKFVFPPRRVAGATWTIAQRGERPRRAPSARRSGTPYLGTRTPPIRTATLRARHPVSVALVFFLPLSPPADTSRSAISSRFFEQLSRRRHFLGDRANRSHIDDRGSIPLANPAPRTTAVSHARLSGTHGLILTPSRCDRRCTLLEVGSKPPPLPLAPPLTSSEC